MLEIIANGSNTYPYQKSTLSDLYRLLETYTLDPVFERYGEFVNRTPCWIDGETARKYSGRVCDRRQFPLIQPCVLSHYGSGRADPLPGEADRKEQGFSPIPGRPGALALF